MDEGPLGVHQVELVVQPAPGVHDGRGVGEHADGPWCLGQVRVGHDGHGRAVEADLEPGGAPLHELDVALGLDGLDGLVDVLVDHVAPVH